MGLAGWASEGKRSLNRALKKVQELEEGHLKSEEKMGHIPPHGGYAMDQKPNPGYDDFGNEIQLNEGKTYIAVAQKGRPVLYN